MFLGSLTLENFAGGRGFYCLAEAIDSWAFRLDAIGCAFTLPAARRANFAASNFLLAIGAASALRRLHCLGQRGCSNTRVKDDRHATPPGAALPAVDLLARLCDDEIKRADRDAGAQADRGKRFAGLRSDCAGELRYCGRTVSPANIE